MARRLSADCVKRASADVLEDERLRFPSRCVFGARCRSSLHSARLRVMSRTGTVVFSTQSDARRFFVDKIVEQASLENVDLSEDERHMLLWSETAPDSVADPELAERLAGQISDFDYETKVASLLFHSFEREMNSNAGTKDDWKQARSVLGQGDHHLLVMIDRAVGRQRKPWWRFW